MSLEIYKSKAVAWLKSNQADWKLADIDTNEGKLLFKSTSDEKTFYIVCPEGANQNWNVWSDDSKVLGHLDSVIDFAISDREKTIEEILKKLMINFKLMEAADETDDEDEMDLLQVNYYNNSTSDVETGFSDLELNPNQSAEFSSREVNYKGNPMAVNRLLRDLKALKASDGQFGVEGGPVDDNLFTWEVKLKNFPAETNLAKDLLEYSRKFECEPVILMELTFPDDYPMSPPFARVRKPKFQFLTGHVTIGGSVCMEVLTKSGWTPTNEIETLLIQIRSEIMSDNRARLDKTQADSEYSERDARTAFSRMVQKYGWS